MKSTLHLKFLIVYIIFGFLCLFTTAILTPELITAPARDYVASGMFQEASLMSGDYFPLYFSEKIDAGDMHLQLNAMQTQLDAAVWFVDRDGTLITSSRPENYPAAPASVPDFDPVEAGGSKYLLGDYHQLFSQDVITVIAPVLSGYTPGGYLVLHKYASDVGGLTHLFLRGISIILVLVFFFSFLILLAFHFFVYRPLRKITEAATQYATGNLEHEILVTSQDEMGYLSASLNYMSSRLRDAGDYQKQFVANVSHDFRSPLTSIRGYVTAMADGTIPPELHEKYLNIILFETERLTDLTNDLLILNEYDTKNRILNRETFDIHQCIKEVSASFEGTCTRKKISIELLLATKCLLVYADKRKIQQVLYNLLDNATKFSDDNSSVVIETTERGDKVYLSVKDDGIGIPRNALNKIWDRFYKTDLSRGKNKKGTGLGLSIVKEAIQAHGENIHVVSTEGVGTEFTFSLPKAPAS